MLRPIRFFPDDTTFRFIRLRTFSYTLSGALAILSLNDFPLEVEQSTADTRRPGQLQSRPQFG